MKAVQHINYSGAVVERTSKKATKPRIYYEIQGAQASIFDTLQEIQCTVVTRVDSTVIGEGNYANGLTEQQL